MKNILKPSQDLYEASLFSTRFSGWRDPSLQTKKLNTLYYRMKLNKVKPEVIPKQDLPSFSDTANL